MRWRQLMVGVAVTVAVMAPAGQALAHAGLESSEPSANAVLETGPPNIVLDFNEAVDARISSIELFDQDATLIPTGAPESGTDDTVVQASVPTIGDGVYVVVWRVPSADGHVVDGVFSFQVGAVSGVDVGALIDKVSGTATAASTVGRLDTAARLLALIGLVVVRRRRPAGNSVHQPVGGLVPEPDAAVDGVGVHARRLARIVRPVWREGRGRVTCRRPRARRVGQGRRFAHRDGAARAGGAPAGSRRAAAHVRPSRPTCLARCRVGAQCRRSC